jgi:nitrate/nitrite-specific signal transduction histidine kinase
MSKIVYKIISPMLLATLFAVTIFIAMDYERMRPEFYMVLLLVVITIFFFGYATGERFASPIQELIERANQLGKGNFSNRIYLNTKDELEELAQVYNRLAEELEDSCQREKNVEGSTDIKVRARTQSMQEIIDALERKVQNRTVEMDRLTKELESLQQLIKEKDSQIVKSQK